MSSKELTGTYQGSGRGYGFFLPDEGGEDWFVPPRRDGGAWDQDTVKLRPSPEESADGHRQVGSVVAVLERANRTVVGTVRKQGRELWLEPDNKRLPMILVLSRKGKLAGGEKIAVEMTTYGGRREPPMGRAVERFGKAGTLSAAVEAILYQNDIEPEFPPAVRMEAEKAPTEVPPEALAGRRDLRNELIITIDGASAKDLDDAVSLTRDAQGRRVLGVHIADVSHYVTDGSLLDKEAWERGTSVYFADRVVPMLPPELSNGICSLNPRVDRLTLTCAMTLNGDGQVVAHEIFKSVIRTTERMTYEDCNVLLEGTDPALAEKYAHILPLLKDMAQLAAQRSRLRRARGSLELESAETVLLCDAFGEPVGMEVRQTGVSEGLIEEFMLAANETVARHLHDLRKPAVYRVHQRPSADKTERLRAMLAPFGLEVKSADHFSLQKVLDAVKGRPEAPAVNAILLRSLMKARYDGENLGHFGLAAEYYCHFTSPIRRYPDLMVHRILTALLDGTLQGGKEKKLAAAADRAAAQSSRRELAAQSAERDIEKCYAAQFMRAHIGESFPGTVSGVSAAGVFVTLPFGAEGMVPVEALPGRDWRYDEERMTLSGPRGRFTFGMEVEVTCVSADPGSGKIDFRLEGTSTPKAPQSRPVPRKKQGKRAPAPRKRR